MAIPPEFRIDVGVNDLLMNCNPQTPESVVSNGLTLPEPRFP
jgi:hypothetical protein